MKSKISVNSKIIKLIFVINTLLIFSLRPSVLQAQTITYDAFIHGHNVGQMTVSREVNDESTKISVDTHIEAHMLVKITVDFKSESTYMNNRLIIGETETYTNGSLKSSVHTVLKNGAYEINKDGKLTKLKEDNLVGADYYYFEIPEANQTIYALATGGLLNVKKNQDNSYYFEHDGKKERHTFENGALKTLEISHKLYTVTFRRKK